MEDAVIARTHDLTGVVLGGRYEVLGKLGVGGMASVYEGRRVGLHNRVAIKVLRPDLCEDPSNVKRFLREARASSVIEHENIVDIVDFGPTESQPVYFVMEFLDGIDLRQEIKSRGSMGWSRARRILAQIVDALSAAHDKAIVHRDVKPANIFLIERNGDEVAKVLDFGIAKVVEAQMGGLTHAHTVTNGLLGTVAYMAPEQARGGTIDARTDIYAVGCVAYQMLTGQVPFTGNNPYVVLERHVTEPARSPRELVADVPPEAEAIVLRCLEKSPDDRFQSMAELGEAIAYGTTLEYGKGVNPRHAPGWNAPHPEAVHASNGSPQQHATEALGSGSSRPAQRSRGVASASHSVVPRPVPGTLAGNTAPISPADTPSEPTMRLLEEATKPSRIKLPALVVLGVALGLAFSLGIVFFVLEPGAPDEGSGEGPDAGGLPAASPSSEVAPAADQPPPPAGPALVPPQPEPTEPEPVADQPPVAGEPPATVEEHEAPSTPSKPRRPRKPRKPKPKPEPEPEPRDDQPKSETPEPDPATDRDPEDENLHPDLRMPKFNRSG